MEKISKMIFTKKSKVSTMSGGNKAFTLAEVLLTLGIIGVVAGMTIPTLIENNQKTQYVTALKKAYTNFNQVLVQYSADNGCVGDLKCTGLFSSSNTIENVGDALVPYFKVAQNCRTNQGCFPGNISSYFDGSDGRGNDVYRDIPSLYKFTTTDGIDFGIESNLDNCSDSGYSTGATEDLKRLCGWLYVDVNGNKGPNNFGRDIFAFYITNGRGPKLYPSAGQDDGYWTPWDNYAGTGTKVSDGPFLDGQPCAGRVIEEGWEMNY